MVKTRNFEATNALVSNNGKDSKSYIDAANASKDAELQLTQARAEGATKAREASDIELKRIDLAKVGIDTFTFAGQRQEAAASFTGAGEKIGILNKRLIGETTIPCKGRKFNLQIASNNS